MDCAAQLQRAFSCQQCLDVSPAKAPENGWLEDKPFLLGPGLFSAFAVSFREGTFWGSIFQHTHVCGMCTSLLTTYLQTVNPSSFHKHKTPGVNISLILHPFVHNQLIFWNILFSQSLPNVQPLNVQNSQLFLEKTACCHRQPLDLLGGPRAQAMPKLQDHMSWNLISETHPKKCISIRIPNKTLKDPFKETFKKKTSTIGKNH